MSKRVWIICQHAGAPRYGMNYRHYHVARRLVAQGCEVVVFSGSYSHQFHTLPRTEGRFTFEEIDGIRYCWIRTRSYAEARSTGRIGSWFSFQLSLRRIPSLRLEAPDAIVVSSPTPYPLLEGIRLARRHKSRLVFEVRDIWPLSLVELGSIPAHHPFIWLTQFVEDLAYRKADRVVSVLPNAFEHMRSRGLKPGKYRHIPNGIDLADLPVGRADELFRGAIGTRRFGIVYAGTFGAANDLPSLLNAARILSRRRDIGFILVGEGRESDSLRHRTAELGLDNVFFLPPVPKTRIPDLLASFDACYAGIPNLSLYRFGISLTKLFDYMAAGKPIIGALTAGNDPIDEAGCGISALSGDPESIAAAIERLADTDRESLSRMGMAGRRYVEENHDWQVLGKRYYEALFG